MVFITSKADYAVETIWIFSFRFYKKPIKKNVFLVSGKKALDSHQLKHDQIQVGKLYCKVKS
jgi:hypothetical protein